MWNRQSSSGQQNWKIKLVILGIFPIPIYSYVLSMQSLLWESESWEFCSHSLFNCRYRLFFLSVSAVVSIARKMGVTSFMGKNHCSRQTYRSVYDFFSFNVWYAYQSNVIYTAVVIFPSSSGKNTSKCCFLWTDVKLEQGLQVWHTALLSGEWYNLQNDTIF